MKRTTIFPKENFFEEQLRQITTLYDNGEQKSIQSILNISNICSLHWKDFIHIMYYSFSYMK